MSGADDEGAAVGEVRSEVDGSIMPLPRPPVASVVAAGAAGLEALVALFDGMVAGTGLAFVIVHRPGAGDRGAAEALAGVAPMPVEALGERVPLEPDRAYVVPPGSRIETDDDGIRAVPEADGGGGGGGGADAAAIDACLRSLALTHGDGFALVLAGDGTDGAVGVRAIKGGGGLVLVQDPSEAAEDAMPRAAIDSGVADLVLPVADLAVRLGELAATKHRVRERIERGPGSDLSEEDETELARILAFLRARTGHDFSRYKRATVLRRVLRRMQVARVETLERYRVHLRTDAAEPRALFDDLLITVTTFFRDPESWGPLVERVVPALFAGREPEEPVRVWVAGCATGEEAYSLVMLLIEEAESRERWPEVQVFATDLDEAALATARAGRYPTAIAADVPPERLARFFVREDDDHYRVADAVRERVLFTRHNLLKDPPFTRLDLVSCRNLLIYLEREAQRQVFDVFRFALDPVGYLFLGIAESVDAERFEAIDAAGRVYRTRALATAPRLPELMISGAGPSAGVPAPRGRGDPRERPETDVRLLAPPSALVDGQANVLQLVDGAGRYLLPPDGAPTRDLRATVRPELRLELKAALERAFSADAATLSPPVTVAFDAGVRDVSLWVRPRQALDGVRRALVIFVEHPDSGRRPDVPEAEGASEAGANDPASASDAQAAVRRERRLHDELRLFEARLRAADEDHGVALDAVRSANEELQSVNEEYRSTAEELETSQEELRSINEELNGVNAELERRLEEVSRAHDDLENLMAATDIGTLFLDRALRIQRFTPNLAELFNVKGGDRGREIGDLTHRLRYAALEADVRRVLDELAPLEREVEHEDGRTFVVRVRPYRTARHRIDGVVLTFVDVSGLKRVRLALDSTERRMEALVRSMPDVAFAADRDGALAYVGARIAETSGVDPAALLGRALWDELVHPDDRAHAEAAWLEAIAAERPYEMRFRLRDALGGHRWVIARARDVELPTSLGDGDGDGAGDGARGTEAPAPEAAERVGTITDVDELTRAEQALREADRHRNRFLGILGHELRNPLAALGNSLQVLDALDGSALETLERGGDVPVAATLETLGRQSRHMNRLVDDLPDLTRIGNGKISLRTRRTDLVALARQSVDALRPRIDAAGLTFEARLPDAPLWLELDPERIEQLLGNLLDNAVKYSDPGDRVALSIELGPVGEGAQGEAGVRVRIADSGIGIAPEILPTLFEPFTQAVGPEWVDRGGLGLGLALVRSLAELHGGSVEASSEGEGRGSEFTLRLPHSPQRAEPREGPEPPAERQDRPRRILVVDDSPDVAEPFAALLRALGHSVETALDGPTALALAAGRGPDAGFEVAFLDLGMPGMNGLELARRLRLDFGAGTPRLVAVTGFGQAEDIAAARAAGFDDHLLKPVRLATVRTLLRGLDDPGPGV